MYILFVTQVADVISFFLNLIIIVIKKNFIQSMGLGVSRVIPEPTQPTSADQTVPPLSLTN